MNNTFTPNGFYKPGQCPHCGYGHVGACPRIKAIEYHANGNIKRIEYHEAIVPAIGPGPGKILTPEEAREAKNRFLKESGIDA